MSINSNLIMSLSHITNLLRNNLRTRQLTFQRWISKKSKPSKRFSDTLNLPKTKLNQSMKDGVILKREEQVQKKAAFQDLYKWQYKQDREKKFILHDGPPYANGDPHCGHALNKILKDITNRYKVLCGYKVHYIPGWDCHGTPIEQKGLTEMKSALEDLEPMKIRMAAKKIAQKAIKKQKAAFKRWGVMANWDEGYYTFDKNQEAKQLEIFFRLFENGYIYEDYMPVHWSPSSRSALAEAELEYNDHHKSKSIYVKFPLAEIPERLKHTLKGSKQVSALVWTTTPWTLPANKAIAFSKNIRYAIVQHNELNEALIVSEAFLDRLGEILKIPQNSMDVDSFEGSSLENLHYIHPLLDVKMPFLEATHVTPEKGTGLVHTAPAHGQEDFQVAVKHGLSLDCMVDTEGKYTSDAGESLTGKEVLGSGNEKVLELLRCSILHQEDFEHSYPYDWRTKQPVILRACKQWFVDTSKIKENALNCLNRDVTITPKSSGHGMLDMLQRRSYWCISRQRVWGVPIPVFYEKDSGKCLLSRASVEHICSIVRDKGTDAWWTCSLDELLPAKIKEQSGFSADAEFEKGGDILDIWFDSGCTWAHVLEDKVSDVYLEGFDQFGGWFQSSLLISVALKGYAPYRNLVVHGFAVDEKGRKMSKSVGNVVDPMNVINGSKTQSPYGADVLRWWAARASLDPKVDIGSTVLERSKDQLFKLRRTLKYLMGNLYDFEPKKKHALQYNELLPLDRYMLHLLHKFLSQVMSAYDEYNYSRVMNLMERFVNAEVSNLYIYITRDRLYCEAPSGTLRRSAQTTQYILLEAILKVIAPVVPHFAEEFYMYHPFPQEVASIFRTSWCYPDAVWHDVELEKSFHTALQIRDAFNGALQGENPLEYDLKLHTQNQTTECLQVLQPEEKSSNSTLVELFQSSTVSVLNEPPTSNVENSKLVSGTLNLTYDNGSTVNEEPFSLLMDPTSKHICERCRRYTSDIYAQPCDRCSTIMALDWDQ